MRRRKAALQDRLRADYEQLKSGWQDYNGYDAWFSRSLNNAQLSTVASYNDLVPYFNELLAASEGDFSAFYSRVKALAGLSRDEREALLAEYY